MLTSGKNETQNVCEKVILSGYIEIIVSQQGTRSVGCPCLDSSTLVPYVSIKWHEILSNRRKISTKCFKQI